MTIYLSVAEVLALHDISLSEFGGMAGIRAQGSLESAVYQPQQSFGGEDLYTNLWDKASALGFSIAENQPFLDGNKRTASLSMLVFLDINGYEFDGPQMSLYEKMIQIATKEVTREGLAQWLKENSKKL